ncbi:MFS transporter [Paraburkholderia sp. CNPSo 3272]|uniref:MFS transporter n=1 Tax=Paraburkholderia sp. CNPSo 3272 TaxID=2940931 RepID=UPI0020B8EFE0|nr:MFS transporter [Paraburkholderia sp. CNPSo 3272]MCP3725766.1 MFS transporter [Paraburkholderia sp. CNPSo 3272]
MQAEVLQQQAHRTQPVASPPRGFTMAILLAAVASSSGIVVIYTVLVTLYKAFPASNAVSWTVTAYWLGSAIFAALSGRLGDLLGYRRILLVVMSVAAAGAVVAACATHVGMLLTGCAMQSIAAGITPLSIGLVRENLPPARLPGAVGLISAAGMVSAGLVYIGAGVVVDHYSWQGGFWFKVALCVVAVAAVRAWTPPSPPHPGVRIDYVRGLAFAPALCAILFAVQQIRAWGFGDARLWGLIVGGIVVLGLWARHQLKARHPLINVRLLKTREVILANACMAFLAAGGMQLGQVFSLLAQQPAGTHAGFGLSATAAGLLMFSVNIVAMVASPWSGRIAARYKARRAALIGMVILAFAWASLIVLHRSLLLFIPGAVLCSFGLAFASTALYNQIVETTPVHQTGEATGMLYVFFSCFFAVGAQAVFVLLRSAAAGNDGGAFAGDSGYVSVFAYIACSSIAGLLIAFMLPKRHAH